MSIWKKFITLFKSKPEPVEVQEDEFYKPAGLHRGRLSDDELSQSRSMMASRKKKNLYSEPVKSNSYPGRRSDLDTNAILFASSVVDSSSSSSSDSGSSSSSCSSSCD